MSTSFLAVLSTFADIETARRIGRTMVEEKLAACANIVPQIESIYHWQGKIESNGEVLVIFKTMRERYSAFAERLRSLHPYETPEIVALEIAGGLPAYLKWIMDSVS